jgi:hypothetical protein
MLELELGLGLQILNPLGSGVAVIEKRVNEPTKKSP